MKLSAWLDRENVSDAEFGRRIGRSHSTVLRLKRGEIQPSLGTLHAIRDATGGDVTADDFSLVVRAA